MSPCRRTSEEAAHVLISVGDGLHNFIGGLAIAGAFLTDAPLGITAWLAAVWFLTPFAAGNFLYLGAVDLVPEVSKTPSTRANVVHLAALFAGAGIMAAATALDR